MTLATPARPGPADLLFALFALTYAALLMYKPALGPIDDHGFLFTLQQGKPFPFYIIPEIGRFYPLLAQEYNLTALISATPLAYYLTNVIELAVFLGAMRTLLLSLGADRRLIACVLAMLMLSPAFVESWFRLHMGERTALVLIALVLTAYRPDRRPGPVALVFAALCAAAATLCKEPVSLMLGSFALTHLGLTLLPDLRNVRERLRDDRLRLDLAVMAAAATFLAVYALWIVPRIVTAYGQTEAKSVAVFFDVLNKYIQSDPFLIIGLPLALLRRAWLILRRGGRPHPLGDALLLGSFVYVAAFLGLRIFTYRYLLPAYALAIPGLFIMCANETRPKTVHAVAGGLALYWLISPLWIGLYYLGHYKYVPHNFNLALAAVQAECDRLPPDARLRLYADNAEGAGNVEIVEGLKLFLQYAGADRVEVLAGGPAGRGVPASPPAPDRADYLLLTPHTAPDEPLEAYLAGLEPDFRPVFATHSPLALPYKRIGNLTALVWARLTGRPWTERINSPDYLLLRRK